MHGLKRLTGLVLTLLAAIPAVGQAQWLEAEGMAAMEAGSAIARQAAIQDALAQAGLEAAARIQATDTLVRSGVMPGALSVRPSVTPKDYSILREWKADGLYHVRLKANVEPAAAAAPATFHKKKVVVARFYLANPLQGNDIAGLETGMAADIARRLDQSGRYLTSTTGDMVFSLHHTEFTHDPDGTASPDCVKAIAAATGSQFVVTGRIRDVGTTETLRPFLGHTSETNTGQGALFPLPFTDMAAGLARQPGERRLAVDLLVYDGLSGALVGQHPLSTDVHGAVQVGRDKAFGTAAFFATRFGQATDVLLGELVQAADHDLSCLPYAAKVVRVESGRVFIDAGTAAGIRPGDRLTVYRETDSAAVLGLNNEILGFAERPAASLVIQQAQPLFAIGELAPTGSVLKPGDIVRAGS